MKRLEANGDRIELRLEDSKPIVPTVEFLGLVQAELQNRGEWLALRDCCQAVIDTLKQHKLWK